MITYANVSLSLDPQIREAAEKWWDEHAPDLFSFPGYHTHGIDHLPIPYPPMRRPPRPGVLVWPTGASRWASFCAFATGAKVESIRAAVGDTPTSRTLGLTDENGSEIRPSMWLLPPRPCFQFGRDELYLLTFVDDRYRWWLKGDQSAPTATTWSALLTGLITSVAGGAPAVPAIPAAYGTPLTRWRVREKPIPLLIDAACAAVGLRLLVSRAGDIILQPAATAIQAEETQWNLYRSHLVYGGRKTVADIAKTVPAAVTTVFSSDRGKASATSTQTLASLALAEFGAAAGVPGTKAQVHGDLVATAAASARTAYAEQAARDYYRWSLSRVDATFRLLREWSLTGLEDRIEWEVQDRRVLTRVIPGDLSDRNIYGAIPELAASTASSNCTPFISSLKPARCFLATIPEQGDGSCSCVPTAQSAKLTYSSTRSAHTSSTLLYGCPPGVFTTLCPQPTGAPKKWNLPVAGLTGDFEHFNQNYTITHSSGEAWTAVKTGVTVTATQTSAGVWSLTLSDGTTTIVYAAQGVVGCCSAITFTLVDADGADDAPATLTLSPATNCGKGPAYTAILDKCSTECMRNARLRWEPVAGSGAKTILFDPPACGVDANGNKFADFSTDDPLLCTGTEAEGCAENKFTVRITCVCCSGSSPHFHGPGWYKMLAGNCLYLTEDTACLAGAVCSGPYETQPDNCDTECEITIAGCDCPITLPGRLCAAFAVDSFGVTGEDDYGLGGRSFAVTYAPPGTPGGSGHRWTNPDGRLIKRHVSEGESCPEGGCVLEVYLTSLTFLLSCGLVKIEAAGYHVISGGTGGEWSLTLQGTYVDDNSEFTSPSGLNEPGLTGTNLACRVVGEVVSGTAQSLGSVVVPHTDGTTYSLTVDTATLAEEGDCDEGEEPEGLPVTYVCVNGACIEVYDGSGTSLADCVAACLGGGSGPSDQCAHCSLVGVTPTLIIQDGPLEGAYVADGAWAEESSGILMAYFTLPGGSEPFASASCATTSVPDGVSTLSAMITEENPYSGTSTTEGSIACGAPSVIRRFPATTCTPGTPCPTFFNTSKEVLVVT